VVDPPPLDPESVPNNETKGFYTREPEKKNREQEEANKKKKC
jgi:hypothetical protein